MTKLAGQAFEWLNSYIEGRSIKPILLFDLAQISGGDGLGIQVWAGVGGGIQVNVVNARLETGYMQTIAPASDSSTGNFFRRFLFQDFF